jgi:hypothetical protein
VKKVFLDIGYDYDFALLGIVSQEKPHRLAWLLNNHLGMQFYHHGELVFFEEEKPKNHFTRYHYADEINHLQLYIIENKDNGTYLIPELRNVDYFLLLKGALDFVDPQEYINSLKPVDSIQLVTEIDHQKLKSKQNLIF